MVKSLSVPEKDPDYRWGLIYWGVRNVIDSLPVDENGLRDVDLLEDIGKVILLMAKSEQRRRDWVEIQNEEEEFSLPDEEGGEEVG